MLDFKNGNASSKEKLDEAIKTFASSDGVKLEDILKNIEGFEDLQINKEKGEYNIKIDGQEFIVISRELIPEDGGKDEQKK